MVDTAPSTLMRLLNLSTSLIALSQEIAPETHITAKSVQSGDNLNI